MSLNTYLITLLYKNLVTHILSIDLTRCYNLGFCLMFFYALQILSGALLALSVEVAWQHVFIEVFTMLDTEALFWIRSAHIIGTSMIFGLLYLHILKAWWLDLGPNVGVFVILLGSLVFLMTIGIAFLGYVLPLSQMSYWGLVVFSNILATIPTIGKFLLYWLWGGEFISAATLIKVHILHVMLPFMSLAALIGHLFFLHVNSSSCGFFDRLQCSYESAFFSDISLFRDISILTAVIIGWTIAVALGWILVFHEESFESFNPSKTSSKIVPEWFFLFFFGFIKCIPSKLGGLLYLIGALLSLPMVLLYGLSRGGTHSRSYKLALNQLLSLTLVSISSLAAVVVLVFPLIELLGFNNLFFCFYLFFKIL